MLSGFNNDESLVQWHGIPRSCNNFQVKTRSAILLLLALIIVGSLVWEIRGITFYHARVENKK